jgi:small subunit ribosomal protein S3Ae
VILAPSKSSTRAAARKLKDRWRSKNWYRVLAPAMFEGVQIGETLTDDPEKLYGRKLDVTLQQLTGDFSKMHIKLIFRIDSIQGSDAFSNFIGHSLTSDYIRRLTRRKRSKMDGVFDISTKDGFTLRIKPMAVTEKRIQTSQQHAIRMIMKNVIEGYAKNKIVSEFIRDMIAGDISSMIFKASKPIYPIKRIEIRRSEVLEIPEHGFEPLVLDSEKAEETETATPTIATETATPTVATEATTPTVATKAATPEVKVGTDEPAEKTDEKDTKKKTIKTKKTTTKAKKTTTKTKKVEDKKEEKAETKPEVKPEEKAE